MTSGPPAVRLRPFPLSELLDESFRLYRRHFVLFAVLSLLLAIPGLAGAAIVGSRLARLTQVPVEPANAGAFLLQTMQDLLVGLAPVFVISLLLWPFTLGTLVRATVDIVLGMPASVGTALRGTLTRYWGLYGITLLFAVVGLFLGLASLLLITLLVTVPLWFWLAVRWSVAVPALLAEQIGPRAALGRSWALVRGRWWRTFAIFIVFGLLLEVLSLAVGYIFQALASGAPSLSVEARFTLQQAGSGLTGALVSPVLYIGWTLLYFDLRVRKEGFDLEQLAQQTSRPAPEPA